MSFVNKIINCIDKEFNQISIEIFSKNDVVVSLYEKKVPISIDPENEEVFFDVEMGKDRLYEIEIEEMARVMQILKDNMREIKEWVGV
ncbi:MAG: hypothetical protein RR370_02645 [Synergistaceae bacterium]